METTMTATRIDRGSTDTTTIYSEEGDLVFERIFEAPRELVWKAFTEADRVPRWWGPKGTTTRVVSTRGTRSRVHAVSASGSTRVTASDPSAWRVASSAAGTQVELPVVTSPMIRPSSSHAASI